MSIVIGALNRDLWILKRELEHQEKYLSTIVDIKICKCQTTIGIIKNIKREMQEYEDAITILKENEVV